LSKKWTVDKRVIYMWCALSDCMPNAIEAKNISKIFRMHT